MVTETTVDGEGTLLKRIREIAPELPIAVSLDLHANLTEDIVANCTALVGYKTYPHIDMYEAGEHAGRIVVRALKGEVNPVMAWGNRPILAQTLRMGHDDKPMGPLIESARAEEQAGLLAASVFGGFPLGGLLARGSFGSDSCRCGPHTRRERLRETARCCLGATRGVCVQLGAARKNYRARQNPERRSDHFARPRG